MMGRWPLRRCPLGLADLIKTEKVCILFQVLVVNVGSNFLKNARGHIYVDVNKIAALT